MPGGYSFSAVGSHAPDAGMGMGPLADASPVMRGGGSTGPGGSNARSPSSAPHSRLLSGLASQAERVATVAARMKNTTTCIVLYVVLMLLNLFVMSVEFSGGGSHPVIILLECLINLFIVAEVSIGIYAAGRSYFSSVINCVDCALAVLCLGFFLVLVGTGGGGEYSGIFELDALLLACRFLFQVLRLSVLAYRSRQVAMMQNQEEVDFNAVSLEACVDSRFGGRRSRAHSHSHSHSFNVGALGPDAHGVGAALDVGLDTPDGGGGGDGSSGSDGVVFTPTSYIHLKPSIFLELQNARAFADPPSITVPGGSADSNEFALRSVDSSNGDGGDSVNSSSHFVPGYGMSPSPLGSPNVPVLTPPPLSPPHDESLRSTPTLSAPGTPTAASSSEAHSESASVSNSSMSATRSLHPLLAHDSEEMDDEHLDLQLL